MKNNLTNSYKKAIQQKPPTAPLSYQCFKLKFFAIYAVIIAFEADTYITWRGT